jgi:hypothetical protein
MVTTPSKSSSLVLMDKENLQIKIWEGESKFSIRIDSTLCLVVTTNSKTYQRHLKKDINFEELIKAISAEVYVFAKLLYYNVETIVREFILSSQEEITFLFKNKRLQQR